MNTIAKDLNLSRSTVKRALHDLIAAGLVEKVAAIPGKRQQYQQSADFEVGRNF